MVQESVCWWLIVVVWSDHVVARRHRRHRSRETRRNQLRKEELMRNQGLEWWRTAGVLDPEETRHAGHPVITAEERVYAEG